MRRSTRSGPLEGNSKREAAMHFKIKTASGGYRAYIIAANGKTLFWTEVYATKSAARHACELVKAGAAAAPIYG